MVECELAGYWGAIGAYAAAFVLAAFGLALSRKGPLSAALAGTAAGLACHTASLVCRGLAQWAPPFITYYESVLFGTWLAALIALVAALRRPGLTPLLVAVNPLNLLLLGSGLFASRELAPLAPMLQSWWLVVHVVFALLAFGAMTVGAAAGFLRLAAARAAWAPSAELPDLVVFRSLALAFLFQLVMVVSGSIWADQAWGRFWGWDPIETFSLLTLIVFAIALHLRLSFGWRGRKLAWAAMAGFLLTVYGIWGVPFFQPSIHLYQDPKAQGTGG